MGLVIYIFMYYLPENAAWIKRNLLKCIKMCTFYIKKTSVVYGTIYRLVALKNKAFQWHVCESHVLYTVMPGLTWLPTCCCYTCQSSADWEMKRFLCIFSVNSYFKSKQNQSSSFQRQPMNQRHTVINYCSKKKMKRLELFHYFSWKCLDIL